jgi:DNA polymerase III gamma/tau subunit
MIAKHSEGHQRDAESLLSQVVAVGGDEITPEDAALVIPYNQTNDVIDFLDKLFTKNAGEGVALINNLIDSGIEIKSFINENLNIFRKILLNKLNPGIAEGLGIEYSETNELAISKLSEQIDINQLTVLIKTFNNLINEVKLYQLPQIPFEILIAQFCLTHNNTNTNNPSTLNKPADSKTTQGSNNSNSASINLEQFKAKWPEFIANAKKFNHSISFILQSAKPSAVNGTDVVFELKYKFHQDRLNEAEIKKIIYTVLKQTYNQDLSFSTSLVEADVKDNTATTNSSATPTETQAAEEKSKNDTGENKDVLNNLINTFGGKVIK